ncbi:unnamed protein product [Lampetra fluviatilis]
MSTRLRLRSRELDDEGEDLIPKTAPEEGGEALPAEQSTDRPRDCSTPTGTLLQAAHGRLAELLHTAASILAELHVIEPAEEAGAAEPHGDKVPATISRHAETSAAQPTLAAAIFSEERSARPAKS